MMNTKWMILLVLFGTSYVHATVYFSVKDLPYVSESIRHLNQIEIINASKESAYISYQVQPCSPYVRNKDSKKEEQIGYVSSIKGLKGRNAEMKVNGIHLVLEDSVGFELINDCTKLFPIYFKSASDQEYLGVKIKKGDRVTSSFGNRERNKLWGRIGEDGYHEDAWPIDSSNWGIPERIKYREEGLLDCNLIVDTLNTENRYYIYKGKKYDPKVSTPQFWEANSKYIGHRLCSDQPNATIDCVASLVTDDLPESVFGLGETYLNTAFDQEEEEVARKHFQWGLQRAKELGKKCDEAVAKYEKETGKKVKISPLYPKELLEKEKKEKKE